MRFTAEQTRMPGNPYDVPYETLTRALKADRGNRCSWARCPSERMITAQRINRATVETDVDSYDNLTLVCPKHATDSGPGYVRVIQTGNGGKRR